MPYTMARRKSQEVDVDLPSSVAAEAHQFRMFGLSKVRWTAVRRRLLLALPPSRPSSCVHAAGSLAMLQLRQQPGPLMHSANHSCTMALLLMVLQVVIAVVASVAWMSVSSGLILLNKDLLSHGFHYPMALSGLGMAFSGTASYLCCRVRGGRPVGVAAPTPGAAAPAAAAAAGGRLHGSPARLSAFLPYQWPAHLPPVFPACLPACPHPPSPGLRRYSSLWMPRGLSPPASTPPKSSPWAC